MSDSQQTMQQEIAAVLSGWIARGESAGVVVSVVPSDPSIRTQVWSSLPEDATMKTLGDASREVLAS